MADLAPKNSGIDMPVDLRRLLVDLQADGRLDKADVERLVSISRSREEAAQHPLNYIAEQQLVDQTAEGQYLTAEALVAWLAERAQQAVAHIDPLKIDVASVTQVMSYAFAQRHSILALEVNNDEVVIASAQPFVSQWETDLSHVLRKSIRRVVADPADIARYTIEFYTLARSVASFTSEGQKGASGLANLEQMLELGQLKEPDANDQHIVNIVDWLLQYAFEQRASDIHIEPRREQGNIRFRIDGVLTPVYELPMLVVTAVTSRIKILGRMDVAEKRRPQDGRLKTISPEGNEVELRLSTLPTAFGEKLVMRIFDPDVLLKSFSELGLANEDYERWNSMTSKPHGIVLVTGPTGSGKTTTLYSTLKQLASPQVNVSTIEDPIEMVEPSFNQMQVQHNISLDFASGVRALLRQDPDIIMIGEIRDLETAEMAIQASLTGHLVLSTLHTNDSPTAITRMLELGVPGYLIKATLLGVMAQRLVRTLCPHCKDKVDLDPSAWEQMTKPWKVNAPKHMCQPVGCLECRNTGYLGRQGLYEVMPLSENLKELIGDGCDIAKLRAASMREGMRTLRLSGAQKVGAGDTTIAEVMRVAPPVDGI
ncbi:MAG: GspE/PulE family protein [Pseudomonadales bacterium]